MSCDTLRIIWLHYGVENPKWDARILEHLKNDSTVEISLLDAKKAVYEDVQQCGLTSSSLLVNRVSDAQNPELAKFVLSLLQYAKDFLKIPTTNGLKTYNIACSKALQSQVISHLGLCQPETRIVRIQQGGASNTVRVQQDVASVLGNAILSGTSNIDALRSAAEEVGFPLLVKPNAGGFGAGIRKFSTEGELNDALLSSGKEEIFSSSNDGVLLVQRCHENAEFYRIWHLDGKVQVATRVSEHIDSKTGDGIFGSNSSGGDGASISYNSCACSTSKEFVAFDPEPAVHDEIERIVRFCGAAMGSIEFMVVPNEGEHGVGGLQGRKCANRRLYFDINMLSTLPFSDRIEFESEELREKYSDPHKQVADFIKAKASSMSAS